RAMSYGERPVRSAAEEGVSSKEPGKPAPALESSQPPPIDIAVAAATAARDSKRLDELAKRARQEGGQRTKQSIGYGYLLTAVDALEAKELGRAHELLKRAAEMGYRET